MDSVVIDVSGKAELKIRAHVVGGSSHADDAVLSFIFYQDGVQVGILRVSPPAFEEMVVEGTGFLAEHIGYVVGEMKR